VEEALTRARDHARSATAEALAAVHALLDAAALASSGEPSRVHGLLGPLARLLEGLVTDLDGSRSDAPDSLLASIAEALDVEIARWEERARDDSDARAVLRAFLGLRELLWEVGMRPRRSARVETAGDRPRPAAGPRSARPRVQRVHVEG
jgi:hypothetical protein